MTTIPDYCFNADDWESTYAWGDRDELVMDLSPGDSMEVSCLKQMPTKWVCCVAQDDEWETLWFDSKAEMEKALADYWRTMAAHRTAAAAGRTHLLARRIATGSARASVLEEASACVEQRECAPPTPASPRVPRRSGLVGRTGRPPLAPRGAS